jgi:hypothetical protein
MFIRHYAIRHKIKVFRLFDKGKRPSDISYSALNRITLYQYYREWRKENGIEGKKSGFAIKPFDRKAYLEAEKAEKFKKEKEHLVRWVRDYELVLSAFKKFTGDLKNKDTDSAPMIYLPVKKDYIWLNHLLRYNEGEPGQFNGWRNRLPIIQRNIKWLEKWIDNARKASSISEFRALCEHQAIWYPSEIENY